MIRRFAWGLALGLVLTTALGAAGRTNQVPGERQTEEEPGKRARTTLGTAAVEPLRVQTPEEGGLGRILNPILEMNTKFAMIMIAVAAVTCVLVLLLLIRIGNLRASGMRLERDMVHTKEALRFLLDLDGKQTIKPVGKANPEGKAPPREAAVSEAVLVRITGELEKLSRRIDDLPRPATSAGKTLYSEEEMAREVERRLAALRIETIEPGPGDRFDPVLHEEVDSKPSRQDQEGTIFRVIQNGLLYNGRLALKARVVVNRTSPQ